jgi:Fe-S cluster biosynthesis and repair protein YggX
MQVVATLILGALLPALSAIGYAAELSDAQIQSALERGKTSSSKKIWEEIKKKQQMLINRAGLDPIEKKVTFLFAEDRIAMEAAEAKRQLRDVNVAEIKVALASPVTEVLLEANCYNNTYRGSLPKWGPGGGVHVVLEVNGQNMQPISSAEAPGDAVSVLPQEHGIVSRQGGQVTYTPLYHSALYERESLRTWFVFPEIPSGASVKVIVISGDGKRKEKQLDHWR